MNRRAFLKTAAASVAASACGGAAPTSPPGCDPSAAAGAANACAGLPDASYFDTLKADLNASFGTPQMLIDLDRLDANAKTLSTAAGPARYRIVEKSLPSLDLLQHISTVTGSNRFLVLHLPFLRALLDAIPNAQVLIGKCQPTIAVTGFLKNASAGDLNRVTFLVDTVPRLQDLVDFASQNALLLRVAVEIDVGLHRGGVRTPGELPDLLNLFVVNPGALRFSGMLGYDGHVTGAPAVPGLEERTMRAAFNTAQDTYQSFIDVLNQQFSTLAGLPELIFNSGGTETHALYPSVGPVNDVAAGGGMLRPASYGSPFLGPLLPASFIAAPVLRHFDRLELPFVTDLTQSMTDNGQGLTVYGGGWPGDLIHPPGIGFAPFVTDAEGENQVPNQSWMYAPASPPLGPGDWVFLHPRQGDGIFAFEKLLLVSGGHLTGAAWSAYPRRY